MESRNTIRYERFNDRNGKEMILHDGNASRSSEGSEESNFSDSTGNVNRNIKPNLFSIEEARLIFELFDVNHIGKICKRDLAQAVRTMEGKASEEEIDVTFKHLDRDRDGWICFEDFYRMFNE
jgi:Ca2+-binding EF-hand superfamily protein